VAENLEAHDNHAQLLRGHIVELQEMIPLFAGTTSEGFIHEHIQQLKTRIQQLLEEAGASRSASRHNLDTELLTG
jgi:hypothetical protein